MKYCESCGRALPDYALFCEACGARQRPLYPRTPAPSSAPLLSDLRAMLRAEHLAWKIAAIVQAAFLGVAALLHLLALLLELRQTTGQLTAAFSFASPFSSFMQSLSGVIAGFILAGLTGRALRELPQQPQAALRHCNSVGSIVLGALFNKVALVFIIINFVRCRCNRAVVAQLLHSDLPQH